MKKWTNAEVIELDVTETSCSIWDFSWPPIPFKPIKPWKPSKPCTPPDQPPVVEEPPVVDLKS